MKNIRLKELQSNGRNVLSKIKLNIRMKDGKKTVNPVVWILFVGYIVLSQVVTQLFNMEASRLSGLILMTPIISMLLVTIMVGGGRIRLEFSYYHQYILLFGLFCFLSSLWAQSSQLAIDKGVDIIEILIIMIVISACFQNIDSIDPFLKAIMWAYYAIILYEILFYGWGYFIQIMKDSSRVSSEFLNSNTLGMCASFAMIINVYLVLSKKISKLTLALVILGIVVIAASGSRKAFVSLLIGLFLYFLIRSLRTNRRTLPLIRFLLALPLAIFILYLVLQLPIFSGIMERVEGMVNIFTGGVVDQSSMIRMSLVQLGIDLFKEHPILGIGIDNPRLFTYAAVGQTYYLHNNYVEILSAGGLVGAIIYYSIYIRLLVSYLKRRDFNDPQYCVCLVLLVVTLILAYGMVSYYSKTTYIFLLLFVKFDEKLRQRKCVKVNDGNKEIAAG